MTIMVFDIETIPDIAGARRLMSLEAESEEGVLAAMVARRLEQNKTEFQPLHLHKIIAISVVVAHTDWIKVWSLGHLEDNEANLIERFFQGLERFKPTLVSWNGTGFDLPVLHYRALIHGIRSPLYWEQGDNLQEFKWNNYINRYHHRHLDLMDVLSAFQSRAAAPLDEIATLLGFPGKMGMKGSDVWPQYKAGNLKQIRDYCETDVLNTYLVFLRFQLIKGVLVTSQYDSELVRVRSLLDHSNASHLEAFSKSWDNHETN